MRVMVTENVETDLDITNLNGACGEIVGIVLHEEEPPLAQGAVVKLRYLPAYILVKLSRTKASKLTGLDDCNSCGTIISHLLGYKDDKGRKEGTTHCSKTPISHHSSLCLHGLSFSRPDNFLCVG